MQRLDCSFLDAVKVWINRNYHWISLPFPMGVMVLQIYLSDKASQTSRNSYPLLSTIRSRQQRILSYVHCLTIISTTVSQYVFHWNSIRTRCGL